MPKDEGNTKHLARVEAEIYDEDPIFKSQWNEKNIKLLYNNLQKFGGN